jgi:3-oxoacyl-[acyl-carrier-protein] synthase II
MNARRVVVTGVGLVTPIGLDAATVWESLLARTCGIRRIRAFDPGRFRSQVAGEIEALKVANYVPKSYRKSTKVMARDIELAVAAAYEAISDAGLKTACLIGRGQAEPPVNLDPTRFSVNIGAGLICADLTELASALYTASDGQGRFDIRKWGADGMNNLTPLWLLKFLPNMLSCHVTIVHDAQAPSNTITCGEASSHLAVGEACRTIARGQTDVCLCGGAESKLNPMGLMRQQLLGRVVTSHNDRPEEACRPFAVDRSGTVISEGSGLLVLEELEHARARGARIYCEVAGFAASTNARDWRQPDPRGESLGLAIRKALRDADLSADQVGMVTASGVGTRIHDLAEARGVHAALGEPAAKVPTVAIKGAVGNNGAGSGAIDLGVTALCLHSQKLPPSPNTEHVDPECGLNLTRQMVSTDLPVAVSVASALGGGQHGALIFKRWEG